MITEQKISDQEGSESANHIAHTLLEGSESWDKRSTFHNAGFVQRYEKGEVQILLEFSPWLINEKYVAVFQGKPKIGNAQYPRVRFRPFWEQIGINARQMDSEICANDGDRQTVFVDNAQVVQTPEKIAFASAIWFDSSDRIYSVLPHTFYLSKSFGVVSRGCCNYRKVDLAGSAGIGSEPKSACHVIQGGSQTLDSLPSDCGNERVNWLNVRDAIRRSALRINLTDGFVWPTVKEDCDSGVQILDVMIGPCEFDTD